MWFISQVRPIKVIRDLNGGQVSTRMRMKKINTLTRRKPNDSKKYKTIWCVYGYSGKDALSVREYEPVRGGSSTEREGGMEREREKSERDLG